MFLFVGDLHFTDHARDDYRFDIFKWITKQQTKRKITATFIAGDITDAKDRHSATLVNKIVNGLIGLKTPVYIAMGNHDYRDPRNPFFKFLNHIDGIQFVTEPTVVHGVGVIPHVREQAAFDAHVEAVRGANMLLVHQTFEGAIAETGARLSGLQAAAIESLKPPLGVYAGDVHRPQTQGLVTYLGCPYHVRFGDNFEPRVLLVDDWGKETNIQFEAPRKWSLTVRGPEELLSNQELCEGDQIKLTIEVAREEAVEWKKIRQDVLNACKELGLHVFGAKLQINTTKRRERIHAQAKQAHNHAATLDQFCSAENVASSVKKAGLHLLGE